MKVIIAGSRTIRDREKVCKYVEKSGVAGVITELVHGGCRGVDSIAHDLFEGVVPIKVFPARWSEYGRPSAGPRRNREMAAYADALIAIVQGESRGTRNMIDEMRKLGKPVMVFDLDAEKP